MDPNDTENDVNSSRTRLGDIDGSIISVHVKNFFCHDNLEIKFNSNINFIVGRNGSGKSAILTALVVGLGARAAVTNRGSNLQSFIKKGANSATIEIKIKNSSENSFKHDVYGDVITISRTILASGGSFYKIKNASGEVVSTKHEDVAMICSVHDIQVDNPICVLNQDDARNFHASDAKKKYNLYKKATNMETIEINYNRALNNCINAKATLDKKCQAFSELEKELDQLKKKYEELQSHDEINQQLQKLQDEYFWSEINDLEHNLRQLQKQLSKQEHRSVKTSDAHKSHQVSCDQCTTNIGQLKEKLEGLTSEMHRVNSKFNSLLSDFQEAKRNWKLALQQLQKKKELINREDNKIKDLTKEVTIATQTNPEKEAEDKQNQKVEIKTQIKEALSRKDVISHELQQVQHAIARCQNQYEEISNSNEKCEQSIRHLKSQLHELNVRGGDNLAIYGPNMIDLVNAIKASAKNGVFSELPRGPIGSYLKVHDKKWSGALEHIMGGSIRGFCVNNDGDSRKLFALMTKIFQNNPKPTITTSKFYNKVHNVSQNSVRAPSGYRSALDCLKIDDPVIANYMIDNLGMESILMVPTHDEAIEFATKIIPKNCSKIVTLDSSEFYPMPNYRSYGGSGQLSKYLQVNTSDRKRQLQDELSKVEIELKKIQNDLKTAKDSKNQLNSQETSLEGRLHKLLAGIRHLEGKLANLDTSLLNVEGGHIKVLTEELNIAKERLSELRSEETSLAENELELRNSAKEAESKVSEQKQLKQKFDEQSSSLKEDLDREQLNLDKSKSELTASSKLLSDEKKILDKIKADIKSKQDVIDEKIKSVQMLCSRIDNPRELNLVISDLKKVEARLNSLSKNGPNKQQVAALLIEKEKIYQSTYAVLKDLSTLIDAVKKTTQNHLHCALQIQSLIRSRVQHCFQSILNLRGYSGSMEINNVSGILEIHCTGRDSASVRVADTTSSLSGGERSYATVAFIMALWDCMELPFYFLDEFDVFMDNVNRKVTMNLLVHHAQENLNRQFVFLTPQDTSTLVASKTVTIHRLSDPVRKEK